MFAQASAFQYKNKKILKERYPKENVMEGNKKIKMFNRENNLFLMIRKSTSIKINV